MTNSNPSRSIPLFCGLILLATVALAAAHAAPPDAQAKRSPLLAALQAELERSMKTLSALDPPAYYMGYTITETQRADVSGSNGALLNSNEARNRWLEVSLRTGKYELDNSHKVGERQMASGGQGTSVPLDDDAEVVRRAIWLETTLSSDRRLPWPWTASRGRKESAPIQQPFANRRRSSIPS